MCDASSKEKAQAGKLNSLADDMASQAKDVFGSDNTVFNNMMQAYQSVVSGGVNQQGFSQAELNARNSAAITNNANQFRNIAGATRAGMAGFGGGNTVSNAGVTTGANLGVAEAAAANTAGELNKIQQENYATGRENFFEASKGEQQLPSVFNNVPGMEDAALKGRQSALQEQQSLDTQAGWWKAPVMGLVQGGLSMATGGLSNLAAGNSFMAGIAPGSKGVGGGPAATGGG